MLFGNVVHVLLVRVLHMSMLQRNREDHRWRKSNRETRKERQRDEERATERRGKSDRETRKERQRDEERATERRGKSDREMRTLERCTRVRCTCACRIGNIVKERKIDGDGLRWRGRDQQV